MDQDGEMTHRGCSGRGAARGAASRAAALLGSVKLVALVLVLIAVLSAAGAFVEQRRPEGFYRHRYGERAAFSAASASCSPCF